MDVWKAANLGGTSDRRNRIEDELAGFLAMSGLAKLGAVAAVRRDALRREAMISWTDLREKQSIFEGDS